MAFSLRILIASLAALGKTDEAVAVGQQLLRVHPGFRTERYARLCPFRGDALVAWLARLRQAGLPE